MYWPAPPIRVTIGISEREYMDRAASINRASYPTTERGPDLELILEDGSVFPEKGKAVLVDREVNVKTGTLTVRGFFPNPHNIYLHDTPSKSLFDKEVRAFSHGCIRVQSPFDLAYALLAPQSDDPKRLFRSYLTGGRESVLNLAAPVPVHLVYFTAWPTEQGQIGYLADIYGRDAAIYDALAGAGVVLPVVQS